MTMKRDKATLQMIRELLREAITEAEAQKER